MDRIVQQAEISFSLHFSNNPEPTEIALCIYVIDRGNNLMALVFSADARRSGLQLYPKSGNQTEESKRQLDAFRTALSLYLCDRDLTEPRWKKIVEMATMLQEALVLMPQDVSF